MVLLAKLSYFSELYFILRKVQLAHMQLTKENNMNLNKSLLVSGLATGAVVTTLAASSLVSAEQTGSNGQQNLIQKIAQRFNLNEDEVEAVFEENREERHAEFEQKFEEKLSGYVEDGKLTEEQKDKIIAKHKEMQEDREANREQFKNMTHEERHAAMEEKRSELEKWAEENDIPIEYMRFGHGHKHGRHMGMEYGEENTN